MLGQREDRPLRPSTSWTDEGKTQREGFPGFFWISKAVHPRTSEPPPDKTGNQRMNKSLQEHPDKSGFGKNQPGNKSQDRLYYWWTRQASSRGNNCKFTRSFRNILQKRRRYWNIIRTPKSRSPKRRSKSDTSEKLGKANNQGVGLRTL